MLLILLSACRSDRPEHRDTAGVADPADDVTTAVRIAEALRADPDRPEAEVLAEHGLTPQELEDLLYRIAADSASAARYTERIESPPAGSSRPRPR